MLKIRLMRIGAKKRPFYRVVVIDDRSKRSGQYLENLGTYNPLTEPHEINLKKDRIDHWIKQGAKLSDGFLRMTGKAPQKPPRKPKKEKKVEPTEEAETTKSNNSEVNETVISNDSEKSQDSESEDSSAAPQNDNSETEGVDEDTSESSKQK